LAVILVSIFLMIGAYLRWFQLRFLIGPFSLGHWLGWIGTLFIMFFTPVYYVLKRRYPKRLKMLITIHVFGNLFAFMLVSIHFAQQVGRPAQFYPDLGTGLALYVVMLILMATGFVHRFQLLRHVGRFSVPHRNRFLHISITLSFYLIVFFHILRNVGVI